MRAYLPTRKGLGLNPRQLRCWQVVLDLPSAEADEWIAHLKAAVWKKVFEGEILEGWFISRTGSCLGNHRQAGWGSEFLFFDSGTALTIYLGHRQSLDLDWFPQQSFTNPLKFAQFLRETGVLFSTEQVPPGSLHGLIEGVRVGFKDFYDVFFLCKKTFSLEEMLGFYQRNFSMQDVGTVLFGLVYFDDAEKEPDPLLLQDVKWKQVKRSFCEWVKKAYSGSQLFS